MGGSTVINYECRIARDLDPTRCKVGRLIVDYDLDQMKDELVDRWRGDGVNESSLRDLADYFNEQLLLRVS